MVHAPSSRVNSKVRFTVTRGSSCAGPSVTGRSVSGTRLGSAASRSTMNLSIGVPGETRPAGLRPSSCSRRFTRKISCPSDVFLKSMTTSTRSAGAMRKLLTVTGCSRRWLSVPIATNGWPLLRKNSNWRAFEPFRNRKRYLRRATRKKGWMTPLTRNLSPRKPLWSKVSKARKPFWSNRLSWKTSGTSNCRNWSPLGSVTIRPGSRSAAAPVSSSPAIESTRSKLRKKPARPR